MMYRLSLKKFLFEFLLIVCSSPSPCAGFWFQQNQKPAAWGEQTIKKNSKRNFFWGHPVDDDHHIDVGHDGALDKRIIKRVADNIILSGVSIATTLSSLSF